MMPKRFVALLAVLVLMAGCGSSKSNNSSAAAAWANGFCGAFSKWERSLKSVASTLRNPSQLSTARIQAARDASSATATLGDDLKALGKPPKTGASESQAAVQQLSQELKTSAGQIKTAARDASSGKNVAQSFSVAASAVSTMATDVSTTVAKLKSLGSSDEWKKAFESSKACKSLTSS